MAEKRQAEEKSIMIRQVMDSQRDVGKASLEGSSTFKHKVDELRLKRHAQAEIEDKLFLSAISDKNRVKLLDMRRKRDESKFLQAYIYAQLVKEKEQSLRKKLEGPILVPLWNTVLGYILSVLYVSFMSLYIVLFGISTFIECCCGWGVLV